jgi:hypothetical protein
LITQKCSGIYALWPQISGKLPRRQREITGKSAGNSFIYSNIKAYPIVIFFPKNFISPSAKKATQFFSHAASGFTLPASETAPPAASQRETTGTPAGNYRELGGTPAGIDREISGNLFEALLIFSDISGGGLAGDFWRPPAKPPSSMNPWRF